MTQYNANNVIKQGHAAIKRKTLAERKRTGASDKLKLKRAIKKEIRRLEGMLKEL